MVAVGRVVAGGRRRGGRRGQGRLEGQLLLVTLQVRPLGLVANASLGCRPGTSGGALTVALSISSSSSTMGSSKYHFLLDKTRAPNVVPPEFRTASNLLLLRRKTITLLLFLSSTNTKSAPKIVASKIALPMWR